MNKKEVQFEYGALGDTLEIQANNQGFTLGKEAEKFEKIKKAINMCGFHVASETQTRVMFDNLHKKVMKTLKSLE